MDGFRQAADSVAAEIDRGRLAFEAALRSGDAVAAAVIYADAATLVAPAADVLRGRPAIERFWRTGVETGIEHVPESGARVVDRGRYLIVHRVEPYGQWRRAAEMFSPDCPQGPEPG